MELPEIPFAKAEYIETVSDHLDVSSGFSSGQETIQMSDLIQVYDFSLTAPAPCSYVYFLAFGWICRIGVRESNS